MAGASVRLVDSDGETTGSFLTAMDGRYRLEAPSPGSYTLLVERIGYESTRIGPVDVRADTPTYFRVVVDSERAVRLRFASLGYGRAESGTIRAGNRRHRVQVELAPEALAVEGVVVSVEGRTPALERVGFYDRMAGINGRFLEREQLGMESARRVSDALQRINGLQRFDQSSLTGNTTRQFVQFRSGTRVSQLGSGCMPAIYVDGRLARWGKVLSAADLAGYPTLDELVSAPTSKPWSSTTLLPRSRLTSWGLGPCAGPIVVWTRR